MYKHLFYDERAHPNISLNLFFLYVIESNTNLTFFANVLRLQHSNDSGREKAIKCVYICHRQIMNLYMEKKMTL